MANGVPNAILNLGSNFKPVSSYLQGQQAGLQNRLAEARIAGSANSLAGDGLSPEMQNLIRQTQDPATRGQAMGEILARSPKLGSRLQDYYGTEQKWAGQSRERDKKILASLLPKVKSPEQLDKALSIAKRMGVSGDSLEGVRGMWSPEAKDFVLAAYGGGEGVDRQKLFGNEKDLRREYTTLSKPFIKVRDSYGRVLESVKQPSAAGDLALIFNYMKMLDPGSVVREGEFATAQNAAGVPARIRSMYNQIRSGERLTQGTRKDFFDRAQMIYRRQKATQDDLARKFSSLAQRVGLNPANVVLDFGVNFGASPTFEERGAAPPSPQSGGNQSPQSPGVESMSDDELLRLLEQE